VAAIRMIKRKATEPPMIPPICDLVRPLLADAVPVAVTFAIATADEAIFGIRPASEDTTPEGWTGVVAVTLVFVTVCTLELASVVMTVSSKVYVEMLVV
jgi:hypothetical protein